MAKKSPSIAKIARPKLRNVYPRERLFAVMDTYDHYPVIWISGPPGSGKTTLVASHVDAKKLPCIWYQVDEGDADIATFFYYLGMAAKKAAPGRRKPLPLLTPEYALGIPTFTRRFFEDLSSRLKPPHVIVFDNYQKAHPESPLHEVIVNGVSTLPEGIQVILISRTGPPPSMARLRAENKMAVMEGDQLCMTPEETGGMIRLHVKEEISKATIDQLHSSTQGWAAGLILMIERLKANSRGTGTPGSLLPKEIFNYFAGEVFDQIDAESRDFLLKTAFLPKMTPGMAKAITGNSRANSILSDMHYKNFFTEKRFHPEQTYQYHALFRKFLLLRAEEVFPQAVRDHLRIHSAKILEESGLIEDAAELYHEACAWDCLTKLVLEQAQFLVMQGRSLTLDQWISSMPGDVSKNNPWLLYWQGMCRFSFGSVESKHLFTKAFHAFRDQHDVPGILLAWSGIVDSIVYGFMDLKEVDQWIKSFKGILKSCGGFPSQEIESRVASSMFTAMVMRYKKEYHIDIWLQRALSTDDGQSRMRTLFHLVFYRFEKESVPKSADALHTMHSLERSKDVTPLQRITVKLAEILYDNLTGSYSHSLQAMHEGLEIAERCGVHIMDIMLIGNGIIGALDRGNISEATALIEKIKEQSENLKPWNKSFYHLLAAQQALHQGRLPEAALHAAQALKLADQTGHPQSIAWCHVLNAYVSHEQGDRRGAETSLNHAYQISDAIASPLVKNEYLIAKAFFALDRGETATALSMLRQAFALGREMGYCGSYFTWEPAALSRLALLALENNIEVDYARDLIKRRNLVPETRVPFPEIWPWPLRVYTLGRFSLVRDEKPLRFPSKAQTKPLDLLKVIIAFGGRDVSEEKICEALWPDARGDIARMSLKSNLHRLRQLMGNEKVIQIHGGRMGLDQLFCWVDVWAFERMIGEMTESSELGLRSAERRSKRKKETVSAGSDRRSEKRALLEKAIALYQGHFLVGDSGKAWTISPRERLRSKFLRAVSALGASWEETGQFNKAAECFQKGLEVDDLAEELYQRLMTCNLKLGQKAEAVRVYQRCCTTLSGTLGVEPCPETQNIYKSIRS